MKRLFIALALMTVMQGIGAQDTDPSNWWGDVTESQRCTAKAEEGNAEDKGFEALDLFQGYWLFDEIDLIPQGSELFSLLRESNLDPEPYLDAFFDTGHERQADDIPTTPDPKSGRRTSRAMTTPASRPVSMSFRSYHFNPVSDARPRW